MGKGPGSRRSRFETILSCKKVIIYSIIYACIYNLNFIVLCKSYLYILRQGDLVSDYHFLKCDGQNQRL